MGIKRGQLNWYLVTHGRNPDQLEMCLLVWFKPQLRGCCAQREADPTCSFHPASKSIPHNHPPARHPCRNLSSLAVPNRAVGAHPTAIPQPWGGVWCCCLSSMSVSVPEMGHLAARVSRRGSRCRGRASWSAPTAPSCSSSTGAAAASRAPSYCMRSRGGWAFWKRRISWKLSGEWHCYWRN